MPDQRGKVAIVTGANSGIGYEAALALAKQGALVILAVRSEEKGRAAVEAMRRAHPAAAAETMALDLSDLGSVRRFAEGFLGRFPALPLLINNAGVMALPYRQTADGFEMQLGTNHLGHFALTGHLLPTLLAAEAPRVVSVSSQAHRPGRIRWDDPDWLTGRYMRWPAYCQSKLANLLFIAELQRQATEHGTSLLAAAAHPGYASTHLQTAGPEMSGNRFGAGLYGTLNRAVAQSDAMGALPQLYAATMPDVRPNDYWGPDRLFEQRGHPKRVGRTKAASNADDARRLWAMSEELTGVTYPWP